MTDEQQLIKEYIISSWVKQGHTKESVKELLCMEKQAVGDTLEFVKDVLLTHAPLLAFAVPLVAGGLTYKIIHPDTTLENLRDDRVKALKREIELLDATAKLDPTFKKED